MILLFTINIAAALSLYWFTGGLVAYLQQRSALKDEGEDLIIAADEPRKGEQGSKITISDIPEAEIVPTKKQTPKTKTKKHKSKKKGR